MGDAVPVITSKKATYTREEVAVHNKPKDSWLIIEEKVYDISSWAARHPGGAIVISSYAGQDASEPFCALHPDQTKVRKYLAAMCIGEVAKTEAKPIIADVTIDGQKSLGGPLVNQPLLDDFRKLRADFRAEGLFDANVWFYVGMLAHILALEAFSYATMCYYGPTWPVYIFCAFVLATAQAQTGWLQHDFGHLSVFKSTKWNHWAHHFLICHLKCASKAWWNWRHFLHHSKPNCVKKDPDIAMGNVFVLGKDMAKRWAASKRGVLPYGLQHHYWHLIGPPLLIPTYFHVENISYAINHKAWWDLFWMFTFAVKFGALYGPFLGWGGTFMFYTFVRIIESHWFVYVTQMNHIPMDIDYDREKDWPSLQVAATCNVEPSTFNAWFTGHLNYQVEHHLFPTMPRHNYSKANERVLKMYAKHGVKMETKTLYRAFADIVVSLEEYGSAWHHAYYD